MLPCGHPATGPQSATEIFIKGEVIVITDTYHHYHRYSYSLPSFVFLQSEVACIIVFTLDIHMHYCIYPHILAVYLSLIFIPLYTHDIYSYINPLIIYHCHCRWLLHCWNSTASRAQASLQRKRQPSNACAWSWRRVCYPTSIHACACSTHFSRSLWSRVCQLHSCRGRWVIPPLWYYLNFLIFTLSLFLCILKISDYKCWAVKVWLALYSEPSTANPHLDLLVS